MISVCLTHHMTGAVNHVLYCTPPSTQGVPPHTHDWRGSSYVVLHSTLYAGCAPPCCSVFPPRSCAPLRIRVRGRVGGSHHGGRHSEPHVHCVESVELPIASPSLWSTGKARVTFTVRGSARSRDEQFHTTLHCNNCIPRLQPLAKGR